MGNWIKLRLAEDEQQEWQQAARAVGLGLSEYVRQAVRAQTGGRTPTEIPPEVRAVKNKETAVEKKTTAKKPKVQPETPDAGLQSEDPGSKAVRVQTHDAEPDDQRSPPAPDHTVTISKLKQSIKGLQTGREFEGNSRGYTPLKEKNSRAMLSLLGLSQPQEVLEPEVLPPEHRETVEGPDRPEIAPVASQRPATRKLPAVPSKPPTVVDDHGSSTATRDWGDVLPIGNPKAEAAAKQRAQNIEDFKRRRLK